MKTKRALCFGLCLALLLIQFAAGSTIQAKPLAVPATFASEPGPWHIEDIEGGYTGSSYGRWFRFDVFGRAHLLYGVPHARVARQDGAAWRDMPADNSPGLDGYGAIALDQDGNGHIVYHDGANDDLRYAYEDRCGWHASTLDSEGEVGMWADIAVDGYGYPHISFHDKTNGQIKYAHRDAFGWHIRVVAPAGDTGGYTSLALEPTAPYAAHIAYYDRGSGEYRHTRWTGAAWDISTVEGGVTAPARTLLAVDGAGQPRLAFLANGVPKYAHRAGGSWHNTTLDPAGAMVSVSLVLAPTAPYYPHLAFGSYTGRTLKYAHQHAGGWATETVDADFRGQVVALDLDREAAPHIAYDRYSVEVVHAHKDGATWKRQIAVSTGGQAGEFAHMAWSQSGQPYVIYYNRTDRVYRVAHREDGNWEASTLAHTGELGVGNDLALDGVGRPHVVFMNDLNGADKFRYGRWDGTAWIYEDLAFVGKNPSLVIDDAGYPHVSYSPGSYVQQGLFYAHKDATGWHTETVEAGNVGTYSSLVLDGNGYPHISYADEGQRDLKYAYQDAGGWHVELLDKFENVGIYTSLVLDSKGYPHISYANATKKDLRYIYRDADGWHWVKVDETDDVGTYTSLALDRDDYPHISYYDSTNGDLKYAYLDASGWRITAPDSYPTYYRVGLYTSLHLADGQHPHIGYYDHHAGILKYASKPAPICYYQSYLPTALRAVLP